MNATELSQIQVDPDDKSVDLSLRLAAETEQDEPLWPSLKVLIGKLLHPLGIHTWVRWRHYDKASDRIIDMDGVICSWCSEARLG